MPADPARRAATALRQLVDRVAHRSGSLVAVINQASVTLAQVLLMSRIERLGSASLTEPREEASASAAALSQMVERLVGQGWVARAEDRFDRRRKAVSVTPAASALLRKLETARATDYARGLRVLSRERLAGLAAMLEAAVVEIGRGEARPLQGVENSGGGVES